jgi:uncharacterized protein YkwD
MVGTVETNALDPQQARFLTLINRYRAQNGAGPLAVSGALQRSSQWLSDDMAAHDYFDHRDGSGRDPFTRMAAFQGNYSPRGENIAAGHADAQETFDQWREACDPDAAGACTFAHRENMLNGSFQVLGIGRAYNAKSSYGWYWTTDFGGHVEERFNAKLSAPGK